MAGNSLLRRFAVTTIGAAATVAAACAPASADPVARVADTAQAPLQALSAAEPVAVPGGGEIQRYQQRAAGLPVLGADAVVSDPRGGPPVLVTDHTVPGISPRGEVRVGRSAAIERALRKTTASHLRGRTTARLVVYPGSGSVAWRVLIASGRPLADYEVLVDAADATILRVTDMLHRFTGSALLYVPNPVVEQGGYSGLSDRNDRDSSRLTNLRLPVTLDRLTSPNGCLAGQYASVGLGKKGKPACAPGANFGSITRRPDKFEAVMAYYHIDRTRAYLDGLGASQALSPKPQRVRADSLADDNSFFSPKQNSISYGTGGVDDAEDAEVIVHEYGHSVQDQAVHFFGMKLQGASMGEGWGDYLAAVMSSLSTGGSATFDPCMFEWDATSYTHNTCARRTDKSIDLNAAERKCQGDPHCIGEAWSGALWQLRAALGIDVAGRSVVDRDVLESFFMLSRKSNFRDGARAIVAADQSLYGGAHVAAITAEMAQRGFCPAAGC